jgi:hypothetical protein
MGAPVENGVKVLIAATLVACEHSSMADADYMRRWYTANRERVLEQKRQQRLSDPEKFRARDRRYTRERPEHYKAKWGRRNAKRKASNDARLAMLPPRVNHAAFDTITPESAYWIGFLMADGCVHSNMIVLALAAKDADHVCRFAAFLGLRRPPNHYADKSVVTVNSSRLIDRLASFGVVPRKSKTAEALALTDNRDFWRGVVDGDGSVFFVKRLPGYPFISLCGSRRLMDQFSHYVGTVLGRNEPPVRPHKQIWSVGVGGAPATTIIRTLYEGCSVALPRKMEKAAVAVSYVPKR